MKKILSATLISMMLLGGLSAEAVLLPHPMRVYLFNNVAGTSIRFDRLINLPNGTMYVPVIPAQPKDVEKLEIVYTYPEKQPFKSEPEVITFNNNYSLLKVLPDGKKRTLTKYDNLPDVVKTGVLPQDMLVPTGFYVSENLRGILGNLEIPVAITNIEKKPIAASVQKTAANSDSTVVARKNGKKIVKTHKKALKTIMPKELANKMYLVTNFDSQYLKVFNPGRPEPIYGLKLKGVLKDVKVTPDNKYLITAVFGKNQIDIADIGNEQIAKSIELNMQPSEIAVDKDANKTYIMSTEGKSIFAINLQDMNISEKVTLEAVPYRMALSPDGTMLAYADKNTDNIYVLKLDDEYKNVLVTNCKNVSKIIIDDMSRMYILSRTQNKLLVNDFNLAKPFVTGEEDDDTGVILQKKLAYNTRKMLGAVDILPGNSESMDNQEIEPTNATVEEKTIETGFKPTEMFLYGSKLFVVCSGDNEIEILDTETLKIADKIKMPFNGFPRKITGIDNSNLALVTDADAKRYAIINLDTNKITGTYPLDMPVYSITIIDKINNINLIEQTL